MKPGQKVVCVDNKGAEELVEGEIYTIEEILEKSKMGNIGVRLCEINHIPRRNYLDGFKITRFRPVDYTFGEKIVEFIEEVVCDTR